MNSNILYLYYKCPGGNWYTCMLTWTVYELGYYSPLIPVVSPIPPIPFRLTMGSDRHIGSDYITRTGIYHVEVIRDLIRECKMVISQQGIIPSLPSNKEKLGQMIARQEQLFFEHFEEED